VVIQMQEKIKVKRPCIDDSYNTPRVTTTKQFFLKPISSNASSSRHSIASVGSPPRSQPPKQQPRGEINSLCLQAQESVATTTQPLNPMLHNGQ